MNGIMKENLVEWELNGISQPPVLCSGADVGALLIGHAVTSGLTDPACRWEAADCGRNYWKISTDGAAGDSAGILECLDSLEPCASDYRIGGTELSRLCDELMAQEHSTGLHAVLLSDGERCVTGRDIGRHNALDIAVGKAIMADMNLSRTVLCTTARLTLETLVRASRAGIPILATRKPVGSLCVERAGELNIAVCRTGAETVCCSAAWRVI